MKLNPLPVSLSAAQKRKLMMRGAVTLKPAQFSEDGDFTLMVMPNTVRRVATAMRSGKGVRIMLKAGENMMDNKTGSGLLDDIKGAFSQIIDKVPAPVKAIAVKTATDFIRKKVGLGTHTMMSSKGSMMTGRGRSILDEPFSGRDAVNFFKEDIPAAFGEGFKPAGGDNYGSGMMVQLGSPYIARNSPAQNPFIAKSIQLVGKGFMPSG